jgi:predicted ATPase
MAVIWPHWEDGLWFRAATSAGGLTMYRAFSIRNFRCFREFTIEPLERVNLIVGKNNTGKTALLEALHILGGPRDLDLEHVLRLNRHRGFPVERHAMGAELWRVLWSDFAVDQAIEFDGCHVPDDALAHHCRVVFRRGTKNAHWEYWEEGGGHKNIRAQVDATMSGDALALGSAYQHAPVAVSVPGRYEHSRDVERLNALQLAMQGEAVEKVVRVIEPRLKSLRIQLACSVPVIHADIGTGSLQPVPLLGEGTERILSLTLSLATAEKGLALIDELDSGLHWSVLKGVWKALAEAARTHDVQIFATTHSWECIVAAHEAFQESEVYDFHVHRLDRAGDDIKAVTYAEADVIEAAIKHGLEMR